MFARNSLRAIVGAAMLASAACAGLDYDDTDLDAVDALDDDPPLADVDALLDGAPKADDLPRSFGKLDGLEPARHGNLRGVMSPVRSQGRRGTCSIFSTIGLMEHLYLLAGDDTPDFSEQYLQWSVKFQVGAFPYTSGSSAYYNLRAIHDYGIVAERVWPYDSEQWDEDDDPACDGEDNMPTRCYTNGQPTSDIMASTKFRLPAGRYLHPRDIKGHIMTTGTAVVAGFTVFYQAWNHRRSELPTNPGYWNDGYVVYPNNEDKQSSLENRAGHSILIFGWDDDLEIPLMDKDGQVVRDGNGNPVVNKGFFLFKNSWGTSGFGVDNDMGAGYGYISQRYIRQYASVRVSSPPAL